MSGRMARTEFDKSDPVLLLEASELDEIVGYLKRLDLQGPNDTTKDAFTRVVTREYERQGGPEVNLVGRSYEDVLLKPHGLTARSRLLKTPLSLIGDDQKTLQDLQETQLRRCRLEDVSRDLRFEIHRATNCNRSEDLGAAGDAI